VDYFLLVDYFSSRLSTSRRQPYSCRPTKQRPETVLNDAVSRTEASVLESARTVSDQITLLGAKYDSTSTSGAGEGPFKNYVTLFSGLSDPPPPLSHSVTPLTTVDCVGSTSPVWRWFCVRVRS